MREFPFQLFFIAKAERKKVLSAPESEKCVVWKEVMFKNRYETLRNEECLLCNLETEIPEEVSTTARPEKKKKIKSIEISRINLLKMTNYK